MAALDGRVAVVTGGAGDIGRTICARLARDGARVWALDVRAPADPSQEVERPTATTGGAERDQQTTGRVDVTEAAAGAAGRDGRTAGRVDVTEAAASSGAASGHEPPASAGAASGVGVSVSAGPGSGVEFLELDVTEPAAVTGAAERVRQAAGRVDILVNCAGIVENVPFADMTVDTFDRVLAVNLRGVFLATQAFGRIMLAQGEGRIVNIASMSGNAVVNTPQNQAAYNTSKAAVSALTRSVAVEWAPRGVRVNALSPGYVDTELLAGKPDQHDSWKDRTPVGRFATVDEVAGAVAYLVGDEAGFFHGSDVLMDGGYTLW